MADDNLHSGVKSVETTLQLLQYLHRFGASTIDDIAESTGNGRSTVHRHMVTLREAGYVIENDGKHRLSLIFLTYGGRERDRLVPTDLIDKKVHQISDNTGERAQFMIEENGDRVYVYTYSGPQGVKTDTNVGKRGPLYVSAAGKAILAFLPEERREHILEGIKFDHDTSEAITDLSSLQAELGTIRDRGYAFNDEESTEGLRAVGVPVRGPDDTVFGAISVSGPAHRFRDEYFYEELPDLLLGSANELELNIKYI